MVIIVKNKSVFLDVEKNFNFYDQDFKRDVDILIIGGGITGVTLSYFLRDYRGEVLLIDKSDIGGGITQKTTAKISFLQGTIYQDLEKKFNREVAFSYYKSQRDAISLLQKIISDASISCDLEEVNSILFTKCDENIKKIKKERKLLESFGCSVTRLSGGGIKSGIICQDHFVFHPLKYLYQLVHFLRNKI